jgi:large subunit ribosomal protein L15
MQLHDLQPKNDNEDKKRVGRGGARGKTSGRGHKGQLARAGGTPRPQLRDRIKKIPKLRGYDNNPVQEQPVAVNIGAIAQVAESGDYITPQFLAKTGLIQKEGNRLPKVKILGSGDIGVDVTVAECQTSETAQEKITEAGGRVS